MHRQAFMEYRKNVSPGSKLQDIYLITGEITRSSLEVMSRFIMSMTW